jgi:hypothetical protein
MAPRQITMPAKEAAETEVPDASPQRKRPEEGRYLLQVDRQTKRSFETEAAAQKAGLAIKQSYPVVQVSIYDTQKSTNTLVTAAPA